MEQFIQQVVDGVAWGSLYGALALSIVLVYRASGIVNFAQGEMAMFAAFFAWQLTQWSLPVLLAIAGGVLFGFVSGVVVERTLIRPLSGTDSHMPLVIVTLGLMLLTNSAAGWIWDHNAKTFPTVAGDGVVRVGSIALSAQALAVLGSVVVAAALLFVLFQRTTVGLLMRAAKSNAESAQLSGVRVERMLMIGWGLAAAIGALVACLSAPLLFLQPNMLGPTLIYAFAAAILGGMESPVGALVGGVIVGVVENLGGAYIDVIGSDFKQALALVIITGVLLVKPEGLFGQAQVARV